MEVVIIIFLILLNGIFSMSEIALVSSRKFKLESAAKKGSQSAKRALELANNPNTFLSTVQIGITLIGILTGIFSGDNLKTPIEAFISQFSLIAPYSSSITVFLIVIIITFLSIVFGELIPKRIGMMYPEKIAMTMSQPMTILSIVTKPFIWLLTQTNDLFLKIFGLKSNNDGFVSEEEIKAMISESTESGEIQEIEQSIVNRVFALGDRKVSELMTHRNDIIWFDVKDTLQIIKQKSKEEIHSIYPVCDGEIDKLLGIVSIKDIFPKSFDNKPFKVSDFMKKPIIVPENTMAYNVMDKFKQQRIHNAIVVDEYGSIQGILTMDDVLDALVGDMTEYNHDDYRIVKRDDTTWIADGQVPFFEFLHEFDLDEDEVSDGNYNTLAGFLIHKLEIIPAEGDSYTWNGFYFEILDMDSNRIDKILIKIKSEK